MKQQHTDRDRLLAEAEQTADRPWRRRERRPHRALTIGEPIGTTGGTNTLKIVRVGEHQIA
jgi:pyruvate kinase